MIFSLFDIFFICLVFFLGMVTSWYDIKFGKIPNRILMLIVISGTILHFCRTLTEKTNLVLVLTNSFIALLIGFFLWHYQVWAAGDAKLFALYSFLIPLHFYPKNYFVYFPSLILLKNLVFPLIFFCFFQSLNDFLQNLFRKKTSKSFLRIDKRRIFLFVKEFSGWFLRVLLFSLLLSGILKTKTLFIRLFWSSFFILFLALMWKKSKIEKFLIFFLIPVFIWIQWFTFSPLVTKKLVLNSFFVALLFFGFYKWLNFYILKHGIKKIKVSELKNGMEIAPEDRQKVLKILKKEISKKIIKLDKGDVEKVKKAFGPKDGEKIAIYTTFPFAPFLFISFLILLVEKLLEGF